MYSLFLYIFALHISGAICTHPQEHKLQITPLGVCNDCGMLVYWSRYWLGHSQRCPIQYLLQWTNIPQPLQTPKGVL
jgi:hypothetical protein